MRKSQREIDEELWEQRVQEEMENIKKANEMIYRTEYYNKDFTKVNINRRGWEKC